MSIRIMSLVWEMQDVGPTDRLVLLSLADHADDEGACYPSIRRLCQRTGMKERGVQNVVKRLVSAGLLSVEYNGGRGGANLYRVIPMPPHEMHPRTKCTPASGGIKPRTKCTPPRISRRIPPHQMHPNLQEPSLNRQ